MYFDTIMERRVLHALCFMCLLRSSSLLARNGLQNESGLLSSPRIVIFYRHAASLKIPMLKESKHGLLTLALPLNSHVTLSAYFALCCDVSSNPGPDSGSVLLSDSNTIRCYSRSKLLELVSSIIHHGLQTLSLTTQSHLIKM